MICGEADGARAEKHRREAVQRGVYLAASILGVLRGFGAVRR